MRFLPACFLLLLPCSAIAQTNAYAVGSTVSGHVICSDTSGPARFAKVLLKSTAPNHGGEDFMKQMEEIVKKAQEKKGEKPVPPTPEQMKAKAAAAANMNKVTDMLSSSTVGMDGAYSFAAVKAGTYYVHVVFAGYIDPLSQFSDEDLASTDPKMKARLAQIPTITVSGTDAVRMDLKIERGAAVSGRLLFDDGTPAAGWSMSAVKPGGGDESLDAAAVMMQQALAMSGAGGVVKTDDQGRYRVAGLEGGSYVLRASLLATPVGVSARNIADGGSGISLTVYSGDTFSKKNAKAMTLVAGEEQVGVDMNVPAKKLHSIVGHVAAKSDGHMLNMGSVGLSRKGDEGMHQNAAIRDDGSFHFEYLPGDVTYTVTIMEAADGRSTPAKASFMGLNIPDVEKLHTYEAGAPQEVALGDADVETVQFSLVMTDWVPPVKKARGDKPEDLFDTP